MTKVEKTGEEKARLIYDAAVKVADQSEFGVADLQAITRLVLRHGIDVDEVQQYLAYLKHHKKIGAEVIGRSFYIIINP